MAEKQIISQAEVFFKNYNFTYQAFFNAYYRLGIDIIESRSILDINGFIFSFISTYNFAIPDNDKKDYFLETIYKYNIEIKNNEELQKVKKIMSLNIDSFRDKINYYEIYYTYLIKHLMLLGDFSEQMTYTFMPSKESQSKYIGYINNTPFFESITAIHKHVAQNIKTFQITSFIETYNSIIVYYYMYYLFIEETKKEMLDKMFSIVLSEMINKQTTQILKKHPNFNKEDKIFIENLEQTMFIQINHINSKINESFSNFEIFPKIKKRIYIDKTLI